MPGESQRRSARTQTFLFADLAGYSALTEAHGDEHAADVAAEFVRAIRKLLDQHSAEHVKAIGDAVLVRVAHPRPGLELARRIICDLGARHRGLGIRVGIHTGTAVERDGDWFGSAVNVAARVSALAEPGEVLLTAATLKAAGPQASARSRGVRQLRNIAHPILGHVCPYTRVAESSKTAFRATPAVRAPLLIPIRNAARRRCLAVHAVVAQAVATGSRKQRHPVG